MTTLITIDSSIISLIILAIIYRNVYQGADKVFFKNVTFINLIRTNIVLIVLNLLIGYCNGIPGIYSRTANAGFNALLFLIEPLIPILWIKYVCYQIKDEVSLKKWKQLFYIIFTINAIASVISLHTSFYFYVDSQNIYSRGDYYGMHIILLCALAAYAIYFMIINRHRIETKAFYSLMMFPIPPAIGAIIQIQHYGVSYSWDGITISLLIIYFNIQDRSLNTDYLTGVYNRRQIDSLMKSKIRTSASSSFAALIIDINNFKQINDKYGHDVGDEALLDAVRIIKKSIRNNDILARFGGDEFFIIMDVSEYSIIKKAVKRIKESANNFNLISNKPYEISFSIGYDIYDSKSNMSVDEFFKHIDQLMYIEKNNFQVVSNIS